MNKADRQLAEGTSGSTAPSPKPTYEERLVQVAQLRQFRRGGVISWATSHTLLGLRA